MDRQRQRLAVIAELVRLSPGVERAALVKWLFLLKILRRVPLAYHFRLHTYGPFDDHALEDVQYAEFLGILKSDSVDPHSRHGCGFSVGPTAEWVTTQAAEFVNEYREAIEWVVDEFGDYRAPDLEIASTLVYVAHDPSSSRAPTIKECVTKAHHVKPYRRKDVIEKQAERLGKHLRRTLDETTRPHSE